MEVISHIYMFQSHLKGGDYARVSVTEVILKDLPTMLTHYHGKPSSAFQTFLIDIHSIEIHCSVKLGTHTYTVSQKRILTVCNK